MRVELKWYRKSGQPKVMQMNKRKRRSVDEFTEAFDKDLPTYIVVHGWKSSSNSDTVQDIKDNYLKTRDCNVIGECWCVCFWYTLVVCLGFFSSLSIWKCGKTTKVVGEWENEKIPVAVFLSKNFICRRWRLMWMCLYVCFSFWWFLATTTVIAVAVAVADAFCAAIDAGVGR